MTPERRRGEFQLRISAASGAITGRLPHGRSAPLPASPVPLSATDTAPAIPEVPSARVVSASSPSPPLRERAWLPLSYFGMSKKSSTTKAAPAGSSDTKKVTNSLYGFEYICTKNVGKTTMYSRNDNPLAYVESGKCYLHQAEFQRYLDVCEISDMFCIYPRMTEDDGTYCVYTTGEKRSTFKHQISRELAEPTGTCAVQNCSHEFCGCCRFRSTTRDTVSVECFQNISILAQLRAESPVLMKELAQKELKRPKCTAPNPEPVRNENVTITPPGVQHSAITTHLPSPGTSSQHDIIVSVTGSLLFLVGMLLTLGFLYKYKAKKKRQRGSAGSQDDSDGASGDQVMDSEMLAKESV